MDEKLIKGIENKFKDHVAELTEVNGTQIVFWHKPGTVIYSMNVIYSKNFIYISGDLGDAVFKTTWITNYKNCGNNDFYYLLGKLSCTNRGEKIWLSDECIKDIDEWHKETIEYAIDDEAPKEYLVRLKEFAEELKYYTDDKYEYMSNLQNSNLDDFDEPTESYLWGAGERINDIMYYYWVALRMIAEYLNKEKEVENERC